MTKFLVVSTGRTTGDRLAFLWKNFSPLWVERVMDRCLDGLAIVSQVFEVVLGSINGKALPVSWKLQL